jgi:MSHA biogenesis protein MshP
MSGKNEQGFSLILAIFLMVVFALLLTALVKIETASNLISGAQVTAERALMAAQSGAEAGIYRIAPNGRPTHKTEKGKSASPSCFKTLKYHSLRGLAGCHFVASCLRKNTDFLITSTGTCGDAIRTVVVGMAQCQLHKKETCNKIYATCKNKCNDHDNGRSCRAACKTAFSCCTGGQPPSLRYWLEKLQSTTPP